MTHQLYVVYVVYGTENTYYQGCYFSLLSFLAHWSGDPYVPQIVVATERPEYFSHLPITVIGLDKAQISEWGLNGAYHFRIKNRALNHVCQILSLGDQDKLVFFDTDSYFSSDTQVFFNQIGQAQALMYKPEVRLQSLPASNEYGVIRDKSWPLDSGQSYRVTAESMMWSSAVIGITGAMSPVFDEADELMLALRKGGCLAHTLEQFVLSESLRSHYDIIAAKDWIELYSTSGQKNWARNVLNKFFNEYGQKPFEEQVVLSKAVSFTRPLTEVVKGHIYKKKKKLKAWFGIEHND